MPTESVVAVDLFFQFQWRLLVLFACLNYDRDIAKQIHAQNNFHSSPCSCILTKGHDPFQRSI